MGSETQDGPEAGDATDSIARLEQALDRIDRRAHAGQLGDASGGSVASEVAARLDALIAQLRSTLAARPGRD